MSRNLRRVMMISLTMLLALACSVPCIYPSFGGTPSQPVTTVPPWNLQAGEAASLVSTDVGAEGADISLPTAGTPLDGMMISIPSGAYPEGVHLEISSAPVASVNLPAGLTIITPILQVDTGGIEPSDYIEISLPLQLIEGEFAMLFAYDPASGALDPLPLLEEDNTHLVAITDHFTYILGVKVNKAELDALNFQTGFRQGKNNWQFTNRGSFIAAGGHCAGQSFTAMDFFLRNPGQQLFGLYDGADSQFGKTPALDVDDRVGYRLASVAQKTMNWDNQSEKMWFRVQDTNNDWLTYYSFALALKASGEPQFVFIFSAQGGGHAMIVYGKYADHFYISDPNYPKANANRSIIFNRSTGWFQPYMSGPNADSLGKPYQRIYYMNKYGYFSGAKLTSMWTALADGTIGNGLFPVYTLAWSDLPASPDLAESITKYNTYVTGTDIYLYLESTTATVAMDIYRANGTKLPVSNDLERQVTISNPSGTPYLVVILGWSPEKNNWKWVDGKWYNFIQSFTGTWHGAVCGETDTPQFRWELDLLQGEETVTGNIAFHACPGGGVAYYNLSGAVVPGAATVTLTGLKTGGRGDLGDNSAMTVQFTVNHSGRITPNFAP